MRFFACILLGLLASTAFAQENQRVWTVYGGGNSVSLSDCSNCDEDRGFDLGCRGAEKPAVAAVLWLAKEKGEVGQILPLRLMVNNQHFNYQAVTAEMGLIGHYPEIKIYPGDPVIPALAAGNQVEAFWSEQTTKISLKGSKVALEAFTQNCGWNPNSGVKHFEEKSVDLSSGGGSISFAEVTELMDKETSLEMLMALNERGVDAKELVCTGTRLGRHWTHLGGLRIAPFICDLKGSLLKINGEINFLNEDSQIADPATLFETAASTLHENFTWQIE